jgi:hypothetical protein
MATTANEFIEFYIPGSTPSSPDTKKVRLYLKVDGSGDYRLHMKDSTGAIVELLQAVTPATVLTAVGAQAALDAATDPTDAPASADVLREDLVDNVIPSLEARDAALKVSVDLLQAKVDALIAALKVADLMASS